MMKQFQDERVMVFIDIRNVLNSIDHTMGRVLVDFKAIVNNLVGERRLMGAYIFDGERAIGEEDPCRKFHDLLRSTGFRAVIRSSSYDPDTREQKEVDVSLACEMLKHGYKDHYDTAIIVSGDRDFLPAVECMQSEGKKVEVASFENVISCSLKRNCDIYHPLDSMPIISIETRCPIDTDDMADTGIQSMEVVENVA